MQKDLHLKIDRVSFQGKFILWCPENEEGWKHLYFRSVEEALVIGALKIAKARGGSLIW